MYTVAIRFYFYIYRMARKFHIGKLIQKTVEADEMTVTEFAKRINLTRDAVYKMFKSDNIRIDLLHKISMVLKHDFFADFSNHLKIKG